ncbi:hypothetical protein NE237_019024 [Protea cynaroides]|uniref:Uncharacterized protein n=1 Tax=Protea cynaroides TaxID=273540 RepID=A0A9Q0KB35_9MAGN|nr:hypothetical protein NE237_019024 [Protea cynaroides]
MCPMTVFDAIHSSGDHFVTNQQMHIHSIHYITLKPGSDCKNIFSTNSISVLLLYCACMNSELAFSRGKKQGLKEWFKSAVHEEWMIEANGDSIESFGLHIGSDRPSIMAVVEDGTTLAVQRIGEGSLAKFKDSEVHRQAPSP